MPARMELVHRAESMRGEIGEVQGLNRFLDPDRGLTLSRMGSGSSQATTVVGKAM